MHYEALTSLRITSQRDPFIVTAHHANNPRVFGSVLDVEDNAQRTERSVEIANVDLVVNAEKLVHPNEATTDNAAIEPTKQGSNSENNSKCCCILQ